jgi:hypothetical protein
MTSATLAVRREIARAFLPNFNAKKQQWPSGGPEQIDSRMWDPEFNRKYGGAYRTTVASLDMLGIDDAMTLASGEAYYYEGRGGHSFTLSSVANSVRDNVGRMSIAKARQRFLALITQPLTTVQEELYAVLL